VAEQMRVELYTLSTCPWSRNARAWLDNHHVAYGFIDYDLADEGMQAQIQEEMVGRGASAFPFVKFGDADFIIGFNPDAFARLLGLPKDASAATAGEEGDTSRREEGGASADEDGGACAADFEAGTPDS
jgi:glutaredoxin